MVYHVSSNVSAIRAPVRTRSNGHGWRGGVGPPVKTRKTTIEFIDYWLDFDRKPRIENGCSNRCTVRESLGVVGNDASSAGIVVVVVVGEVASGKSSSKY